MKAVVLAIALALVLAAITHIVVILGVPSLASRTIADRIEAPEPEAGFVRIADASLFLDQDPNLLRRVCAFDLSNDSALLVEAAIPSGYWSVSVHDRFGLSYTSLNDRAAQDGTMRLLLATRRQARALSDADDPRTAQASLLRISALEGYVVLRALVDRRSRASAVETALDAARCERLPVDVPPPRPQSLEELIGSAPSSAPQALVR